MPFAWPRSVINMPDGSVVTPSFQTIRPPVRRRRRTGMGWAPSTDSAVFAGSGEATYSYQQNLAGAQAEAARVGATVDEAKFQAWWNSFVDPTTGQLLPSYFAGGGAPAQNFWVGNLPASYSGVPTAVTAGGPSPIPGHGVGPCPTDPNCACDTVTGQPWVTWYQGGPGLYGTPPGSACGPNYALPGQGGPNTQVYQHCDGPIIGGVCQGHSSPLPASAQPPTSVVVSSNGPQIPKVPTTQSNAPGTFYDYRPVYAGGSPGGPLSYAASNNAGPTTVIVPGSGLNLSSIPTWVWIAAAGAIALMVFKK